MDDGSVPGSTTRPVWDDVGGVVRPGMSIEKIIARRGLDWDVVKLPLYTDLGPAHGRYAVVREDTADVLGIVGARYVPAQNAEVFGFFHDLVGSCGLNIDRVGYECGGKTVWATAKLPFGFSIRDKDDVDSYFLFRNNHAGERAISIGITTVRLWCSNVLDLAFSRASLRWSFPHVREFDSEAKDQAAEVFQAAKKRIQQFEQEAKWLVNRTISPDQALKLVIGWVGDPDADEQPKRVSKILALYDGEGKGSKMETAKGTAWGLLNALTEFIDHHNTGGQQSMSRRMLQSAMSGKGANLKQRVLNDLLEWPMAA